MQADIVNIPWEFTDKKVTAWGGMRMFKEFLDKTGIYQALQNVGLPDPKSNRGYNPIQKSINHTDTFHFKRDTVPGLCQTVYPAPIRYTVYFKIGTLSRLYRKVSVFL